MFLLIETWTNEGASEEKNRGKGVLRHGERSVGCTGTNDVGFMKLLRELYHASSQIGYTVASRYKPNRCPLGS